MRSFSPKWLLPALALGLLMMGIAIWEFSATE